MHHNCMAMPLELNTIIPKPRPKKSRQVRVNMMVLLKVVLSIRNTTLKLCADCAKQLVRNSQNCEKTNNGICTKILAKNKIVIMPQPRCSPDLASADFFLFPKLQTAMKGKRFATVKVIKENRSC